MRAAELSTLVERARQGESAAYDTLVDLYANRLYGYLYRLTGSRTEAEDLFQEVFVRVVRMLPAYRDDGRFEGWLFRIATNLVRDHVRRLMRNPPGLSMNWEWQGDGDARPGSWEPFADEAAHAPDRGMRLSEDVDALQRALAELSAPEREVVMLRHFSEMSFADIAQAMGTPLGTALARAHRGLAKLRRIMGAADDV